MSNVSTFGGFATARLGIYASQKALEVTGNNISNINTPGYTRQKLNQKALHVGGVDHYSITNDIRVGAGALCTSVSQLRDPYLDIRYRNENANVGAAGSKLGGLQSLSAIFDEVGRGEEDDGVLELSMKKLFDAIQAHNTEGSNRDQYDTITRGAAEDVVKWFNDYAKQLETLHKDYEAAFRQDLQRVNTVLTGIRDLNEAIRKENIHGGDALELKDERNLLIDELSGYMRIHVTYSEEDIGAGMTVEKLKIDLADKTSVFGGVTLIDGIFGAQLSVQQQKVIKTNEDGKEIYRVKANPAQEATLEEIEAWLKSPQGIAQGATMDDYEPVYTGEFIDDPMYRLQSSVLRDRHDNIMPGEDRRMDKAVADPTLDVEKYINDEDEMFLKIGDNFMYGSLQASREMLTESGEYSTTDDLAMDPDCGTKRGIPFYQKAFDNLANIFAKWMNDANAADYCPATNPNVYWNKLDADTGVRTFYDGDPDAENSTADPKFWAMTTQDADGKDVVTFYTTDPTGKTKDELAALTTATAEEVQEALKDSAKTDVMEEMRAGVLFSNSGDGDETEGITARNLSISKSWSIDAVRIQRTKDPDAFLNQSTNNDNLDHFVAIMDSKFDFKPSDVGVDSDELVFNGTFFGMLTKLNSILGTDTKSTEEALDNYEIASEDLYLSREGVSGVDLNDETVNMMQFQKSYSAACRLLTTIDEMLERLINNTGIVGR